jgi:hypothetical protein
VKRFFSLLLIAVFLVVPTAQAAPKKISVKAMQLLATIGTPEEVSGTVVSGKSIVVFGTKSAKAYARAVDATGKELWNLSLDQAAASIATAAAVDAAGDIWITGSTPVATQAPAPTPTPTPLNPDNAVIPPSVLQGDLQAITLWKVSAAGLLLFTTTLPTNFAMLPTAIVVDKNGTSIVGISANEKGNNGFLVNTDSLGAFTKLLQIGVASTTADAVVRHSDGSFTVVGSSSETIAGKKLAGVTDGYLIKVSKALKITTAVRSSATKGKRIWSSASSSLLLGGEVIAAGKTESAVTKFSTAFAPTWTYRFASTGPTLTAASTQALFISTAAIAQLNWNPKVSTPLVITFDAKGVITAAHSGPVGQKDVISLLVSKELGVLAVISSAETVSIFTLNPR